MMFLPNRIETSLAHMYKIVPSNKNKILLVIKISL